MVLLLLVVLAVSACAGTGGTASPAASDPVASPGSAAASSTPGPDASETPAGQPAASDPATTDEPQVTDEPTASNDVAPSEPGATPEAPTTAGSATACSGSDANRKFFDQAAAAVGWPVYCAVLPGGWNVSTGSYRLASGGRLEISYKGPGGATLTLSEGSFCTADDGCVPAGTDAGAASFGSRPATLVSLADGGYAVVADRGSRPSWLLVAHGVDQAMTEAIAAAFAEVAD